MTDLTTPLPCPFCGAVPEVTVHGSGRGQWAGVRCVADDCPAEPEAVDDTGLASPGDADVRKVSAIRRWNQRARVRPEGSPL